MSICGQSPLFIPTTVNAQIRNIDAVDIGADTIHCNSLNVNGEAISSILQNIESSGPDVTNFNGLVNASELKSATTVTCDEVITNGVTCNGQIYGESITTTGAVSALEMSGIITTATQDRITKIGTQTSLDCSGNITQTGGTATLRGTTVTSLTTSGNITQSSTGATTLSTTTVLGTLKAAKSGAGTDAISIGTLAGTTSQIAGAIAIGYNAGNSNQKINAIAIGYGAGQTTQGASAIAIGNNAGVDTQSDSTVAIGASAGRFTQGNSAVAIGSNAGKTTQGANAVAIGLDAGAASQGASSIMIGRGAGSTTAHANTIMLNATGTGVQTEGTERFYVTPVRGAVSQKGYGVLAYDNSTGEIVYGTDEDISTAGNITQSTGTASLQATNVTSLAVSGTTCTVNGKNVMVSQTGGATSTATSTNIVIGTNHTRIAFQGVVGPLTLATSATAYSGASRTNRGDTTTTWSGNTIQLTSSAVPTTGTSVYGWCDIMRYNATTFLITATLTEYASAFNYTHTTTGTVTTSSLSWTLTRTAGGTIYTTYY